MSAPLNIAIVEDNHHIRKGLIDLLSSDNRFRVVAQYENGEMAVEGIPVMIPDLVIMDIEMPGMKGTECVAILKKKCPTTQFMMFTVFEESEHVFKALQSGASGYLLKTASSDEIIEALIELKSGGSPMSPLIARKVVMSFQKNPTTAHAEVLSDREKEILQHLSEGLLYKEIGDKLGISLGTVKQHLHRIYEKLHVNNKTEAINKVFRS